MKMKYEEVQAEKALELSPHHHAYINPYTGCSMGCPFCFWLSMEGWEGRIGVRKNLPELLRRELKDWPKDEFLYLGSICDPFNEMEEQYGIAQECLKVIEEYHVFGSPAGDFKGGRDLKTDEKSSDPGDGAGPDSGS